MQTIAIAIGLTHQGFGPIVFPFDKAIGNAQGQKLEKGEDFLSPILEGGERFAHLLRPMELDLLDPDIQCHGCRGNGSCGIPGAQLFFELPGHFEQRKVLSQTRALWLVPH